MRPKACRLAVRSLLAAGMLLFVGGCWDNQDINHRALPIVMGVAKHDGNYKVYLHIPVPERTGISGRIVSGTGSTISAIVDRIGANMESRVDLLHVKVILLERGYAEQGVNESVTSFMRSRDISPKSLMVISDDKLDSFFGKLNTFPGNGTTLLYDFFGNNAGRDPQIAQTRIWEMYRSIHSYTHDVAVPIVRLGKTSFLESAGSAVIKNGRMVDRISPDETLLLNAYLGLSTQGKIEVMNHATVQIVGDSISHRSSVKGGKLDFYTRVKLEVSVLETRDEATEDKIKQELESVLVRRYDQLIHKIQKDEADILGIGQFFRSKLSREQLAHWRSEYFPIMKLHLGVSTIIRNEGNLKTKQ